ncbi:MAG: DUF429 domain-containing protein [Chloroflexi bacterium]|nr:DUF429 domain-containing protein [Chloroflexota bacterium]
MVKIYGIDFTSAPRRGKSITCADCTYTDGLLIIHDCLTLTDFTQFERLLALDGPWIAGLDFPFGQPARLIDSLGWGQTWAEYVAHIESLTLTGFDAALAAYRQRRPPGDKQHLRPVDVLADARSPMMLYGVPVGRMFFQGAPRLLKAGVSVLPCHPQHADDRVVLETYPALVARKWIGRESYKSDNKKKRTEVQVVRRQQLVEALQARSPQDYGIEVVIDPLLVQALVDDPTGDQLDAVLCALQAAWAYTHADRDYGISPTCDPREGWIVDPALLMPSAAVK